MKKLMIVVAALAALLAAAALYAMTAEIPAPSQPVEKVLPNEKYLQ
ncbi:MAG: hypothetical protein IT567_06320 [Alphaproteobacteria bacterium]|nr:hypothetical protein [Alphaproteobacteria bacterium]